MSKRFWLSVVDTRRLVTTVGINAVSLYGLLGYILTFFFFFYNGDHLEAFDCVRRVLS